jgi:site-specific DNA recombinase
MPGLTRNIGLVYYRTSTHLQFKKISPDLQRQECLALAKKDGCEIDESRDIYWDNESAFVGKGGKRPGFQRLTERWKNDPRIRGIYIYDLSRLFRDARAYFNYKYELEQHDIELVSVIEPLLRENTPAARLPAGVIALVNEYNSALYGNKIREAMRFKAASGVYPTKAPYGYKNRRSDEAGKNRAWIEVNPGEAPWVRHAFTLFASGKHTLHTLTATLRAEGFPSRRGRPVMTSVLARILKNPLYIGWVEWGGERYENGTHETIVDRDLFDRAQSILAAHNRDGNRKRKHQFLLRGLAWCAECGSRLQAGYARGRSGQHFGIYQCPKTQHGVHVTCAQRTTPLQELDHQFASLLAACRLAPRWVDKVKARLSRDLGDKQRSYEDSKRALVRSLEDVKAAKTKAFVTYSAGEIEGPIFQEAMRDLNQKESQLAERLARLDGNLTTLTRVLTFATEIAANIPDVVPGRTNPLNAILADVFLRRLEIRDQRIVSASLSVTAEYILGDVLKDSPVFKLAMSGAPTRSLIEHLLDELTPRYLHAWRTAGKWVLSDRRGLADF